jgi:hypothetical protein
LAASFEEKRSKINGLRVFLLIPIMPTVKLTLAGIRIKQHESSLK